MTTLRIFFHKIGDVSILILGITLCHSVVSAQSPRSGVYPQNEPYCILRVPAPFMGPNCYQLFMCSARVGVLCTSQEITPGSSNWTSCQTTQLAERVGFIIDPTAHPLGAETPFLNFESADKFMQVLSPYGGDWYGCFGPPLITNLPSRTPTVSDASTTNGFCVLRKPEPYQPNNEDPPICFEFYKAKTDPSISAEFRRASINAGICFVTDLGAREGWEVDPNFGGPYTGNDSWMQSEKAMQRLSKYADDFYECIQANKPGLSGTWIGAGNYIVTLSGDENQLQYTGTDGNYKHSGSLSKQGTSEELHGEVNDVPGFCCGNRGKVWLRINDENSVEVRSEWYRPGESEPFITPGWQKLTRRD